jgi:hypothetical protein
LFQPCCEDSPLGKLRDLKQKVRDLAHILEILCFQDMIPAEHGPTLCAVDRGSLPNWQVVIRSNFYHTPNINFKRFLCWPSRVPRLN